MIRNEAADPSAPISSVDRADQGVRSSRRSLQSNGVDSELRASRDEEFWLTIRNRGRADAVVFHRDVYNVDLAPHDGDDDPTAIRQRKAEINGVIRRKTERESDSFNLVSAVFHLGGRRQRVSHLAEHFIRLSLLSKKDRIKRDERRLANISRISKYIFAKNVEFQASLSVLFAKWKLASSSRRSVYNDILYFWARAWRKDLFSR